MGENSSNSGGNFQVRLLKPQSKCTEYLFEQKHIARRNIVSLICLGLRAKIICFLTKFQIHCCQNCVLRLQSTILKFFVNIFPLSYRYRDWRKKTPEYSAKCLAQLLKLNSTRTKDILREIKLLTLFFLFSGPRASTFQSLANLSGPVVKTLIYMYRGPLRRETKFSMKKYFFISFSDLERIFFRLLTNSILNCCKNWFSRLQHTNLIFFGTTLIFYSISRSEQEIFGLLAQNFWPSFKTHLLAYSGTV